MLLALIRALSKMPEPSGPELETWESLVFHCKTLETSANDLVAGATTSFLFWVEHLMCFEGTSFNFSHVQFSLGVEAASAILPCLADAVSLLLQISLGRKIQKAWPAQQKLS